MLSKYTVGFTDTTMGCASLGYTEREGRDRTEEMRRYAEYVEAKGYVVTETGDGWVRLKTDAGGIFRKETCEGGGKASCKDT